ncbi:MAG: septum formation protein Maf [Myxococcales bacterium FL481]|nr:MAG: septum formation protein Maf [Myxococcales bacterium FL481]
MRFVLASGSPRRAQLLASAGLTPSIVPARDLDESWRPPESPVAYTRRLAEEKGVAVAATVDEPAVLLAADTTVWFQDEPIGKPRDRAHAHAMLSQLTAGTPHRVTTACAVLAPDRKTAVIDVTTTVSMRRVPPAELQRYLDGEEWTDKAGGYAIQGGAASFVTRIDGSYTNVVGLPLAEVIELLAARGIVG